MRHGERDLRHLRPSSGSQLPACREQAEILADERARLSEQLATKQDIALLRAELVAMEQRLKGGMLAAAVAIIAALGKLL